MSESDNLGPSTSWHIRSVPEAVRQAVVDRAHAERLSVGELLTKLVIGGDAVAHAVGTVDVVAHAVDADKLLKLLQAAELLHRLDLARSAQSSVKALIASELRAMRRTQRKAPLALAAPI